MVFASLILCVYDASATAINQNVSKNDVRLLVDVSGSMKQNDPENLRAPALRLIAGLLDNKSKAGIWLFGEHTQRILAVSTVDDLWKSKARAGSTQIHSRSPYTDIEKVLVDAMQNWSTSPDEYRRNIILLTDGWVDISKDSIASAASRQRILQNLLPKLIQNHATVHTIALTDNADDNLLRQLSVATGGRFEKIKTAEKLERVFLQLFEQATSPNSLPIENNRIVVDKSIRESTFLIFRKDEQEESKLISPDGSIITNKAFPANVRWHSEQRYDLITVTYPLAGEWTIDAHLDPDNRVIAVTDVELKSTKSYTTMLKGEKYPIEVRIEQKGNIISNQDFLRFVQFSHSQIQDKKITDLKLNDGGINGDKIAGDGIYSGLFDAPITEGRYEFVVYANGTTFKRQQRSAIDVVSNAVVANISPNSESANQFELSIIPKSANIDLESLKVYAFVTDSTSQQKQYVVPRINPAEWKMNLSVDGQSGTNMLEVNIVGRSNGGPLSLWLDPIKFGDNQKSSSSEMQSTTNATTAEAVAPHLIEKKVANVAYGDWLSWAPVAFLNIVVLPLALCAIVFYRKWAEKEWIRLASEIS